MVITIQLLAGPDPEHEVEISSQVDLRTEGPGWHAEALEAVAERARQAASCLIGRLPAPLPEVTASFVPLHAVLPIWK